MRTRILLLIAAINFLTANSLVNSRTVQNFNREWKFQLGNMNGAEQVGYDDKSWQLVGLPHSFSIPYFMSPDFYVGYGWYRKVFDIPENFSEKRISLEFEAAFQDAEIFINGRKAGSHKGGYTGFSIDISHFIHTGKNTVAVRLNNLWNGGLAPRAGEHVFSGGLYRDVYLVVTNPIHVNYCGTFVTTPKIDEHHATVNVKTEIKNSNNTVSNIQLITEILSPSGEKVSKVSSKIAIKANDLQVINQTLPTIANPLLWDLNQPHLYKAVSKIFINNQLQDEYTTTFGIRSIRFTADKGFFLNGKKVYLLGANVHQDHAGWGDAVTNLGFFRDVKMMKEAGFNFIRGSHYPHDPAFVEACDKLGMLFWSENPFWGIGGSETTPEGYWNSSSYPTLDEYKDSFELSLKRELREMIRIHRNNPSVIVWSMSNEPFFTDKNTQPAMRDLLKSLVAIAHEEDTTRLAAIGGAQRPFDKNRIDLLGDIAGYNGDGGTLPAFQNPGIPSVVSEYGSTTAERPGNYEPGWGDLSSVKGKAVYEWRSGQAIWCGFDHGSIAGSRLGKMGIVDYFRIPKRAWYWYRNEYAKVPPPVWLTSGIPAKLRLDADRTTAKTDGTEDVKLVVTVLDANGKAISNNPTVELKVISGSAEFPTGSSILFEENSDIRILDGQAAIECRSWYAGKSVIRASGPGLESVEISVDFVGGVPYIDGVTPKVTERPYSKFCNTNQPNIPQKFGQNNPTFASSFMPEHPTGSAADGNENTWWQAMPNDLHPSFTLDTEKKLELITINLIFPVKEAYQFKIEVSDNLNSWTTIADYSTNQEKIKEKQLTFSNTKGGIIRISFVNAQNAKIAEIGVIGNVIK